MIASAKLHGEILSGEGFTPRGVSAQFDTQELDGAWPNVPPAGTDIGKYSPETVLSCPPGSPVHAVTGEYNAVGPLVIDPNGTFFNDPDAAIEYWLDSLGTLEIAPLLNETSETLIVSSLRISGVEAGEPYAVDFAVEYRPDTGAGRTRAVLDGTIARSTLKGGRGAQEVRRFLAAATAAAA